MIDRIELVTERLRIRHFEGRDRDNCIRFRREVFGLDENPAMAESWLRWTIDSYRELAKLEQPPYADYAVGLKDSGDFIGAAGIVPTVVPWGSLTNDTAERLAQPGSWTCSGASCPIIDGAAMPAKRQKP